MRSQKNKKLFQIVFYLFLIGLIGYAVFAKRDLLTGFSRISPRWVLLVIMGKIFVQWVSGLRLKFMMQVHGVSLPSRVWLALTSIGTLQNGFLPGNTAIASRAWYLNKYYSLGYADYAALLFCANIIFLWVNTIALILLYAFLITELYYLTAILSLVSLTSLVLLWFSKGIRIKNQSGFLSLFQKVRLLLSEAEYRKKAVVGLFLSESGLILVRSFALWLSFCSVSYVDPGVHFIVISIVVSFSSIINITPGNLGVTESLIVSLAVVYGIPLEVALAASVVSRTGSLISQAMVAGLFSRSLVR